MLGHAQKVATLCLLVMEGTKSCFIFFKSEPMQRVCGTGSNARDAVLKVSD
jgi:hypothetical protein